MNIATASNDAEDSVCASSTVQLGAACLTLSTKIHHVTIRNKPRENLKLRNTKGRSFGSCEIEGFLSRGYEDCCLAGIATRRYASEYGRISTSDKLKKVPEQKRLLAKC